MTFGMVMLFLLTALLYASFSVFEHDSLNIFGYILHIVIRFIVFSIMFGMLSTVFMGTGVKYAELDVDLDILTKEYANYKPTVESKYTLKETADGVQVIYEFADGTTSAGSKVGVKKEKISAQIEKLEKEKSNIYWGIFLTKYKQSCYFNILFIVIEFIAYLDLVYKPNKLKSSKRELMS